ncbi:GAF domain-containing protein [Halosegnis marinus]|uniref:GAF domain-containing protein n=1 Tax=Halosegnis marinus TaxID=3034023 RepID=UPI0036224609
MLPFDEEFRGTVGVVRNIAERVEREERIDRLRDRTRKLMYTDTVTETAEVAIRAADDLIGAPLSAVHLFDEEADALEPAATVETVTDSFDEIPRYPRDAEPGTAAALVWETFESGEPLRIDDSWELTGLDERRPARSVVLHPLGRHGMFIVSSDEPDAIDDTEEALVELLAASLRTALDRVEREAELRDQRDELRRRNERLDQFASVVSHDLRNPSPWRRGTSNSSASRSTTSGSTPWPRPTTG